MTDPVTSATSRQPAFLVALNEVNVEFLRYYIRRRELPNFADLLTRHGVTETVSEQAYEHLEPWIQWVTVHTGLPFARHRVFRLGDIMDTSLTQIWEHLEREYGCRVGAVSPMNAANRSRDPLFFVPDPWTRTTVTGDRSVHRFAGAVASLVNENATGRSSLRAYLALLEALLRWSPGPRGFGLRLARAVLAVRDRAQRAVLLDELLADLFLRLIRRHQPDFASLFLNGAAHLQHHHMLDSPACAAPARNPGWYMKSGSDPLLQVYRAYDVIVGRLRRLEPHARLILATGLHQDPVERPVFYWRLADPGRFLAELGISHLRTEGRMSRDFMLAARDAPEAAAAATMLRGCRLDDSPEPLFEIDERGDSLFVTLTWPHDVPADAVLRHAGGELGRFRGQIAFVALKNGHHNGIGYMIDTGAPATSPLSLGSLFDRIDEHFRGQTFARAAE